MTMGPNVITREELYELVWSTPMIKVAEKFEVSGSYLARVCTELGVPRPERGYSPKLAVGKAPQRPALPEPLPGDPVVWSRTDELPAPAMPKPRPAPSPRVPGLARPVPGTHGLIRGAKEHFLVSRKIEDAEHLKPYKRLLVDITVARSGLGKALGFASDLINALESAGHRVVIAPLDPRGKRRGKQCVIGNLQGAPGDSLVIELEGPRRRGLWVDFDTGESGDVLALWACVRGYALPADFSDLLDDAGDWLVVSRIAPTPALRSAAAHDDLGPHTGKWDYVGADGQLLACVYRYDTPTGKPYRPWDARARAMCMPEPRPLYNLPAITASDAVGAVEGEKCADALMHLGIVATTAKGGAATAIDKTDCTPLAGKTVAVWPDHDDAGARYADAVIPKLIHIGAKVREVSVPQAKRDAPGQGISMAIEYSRLPGGCSL